MYTTDILKPHLAAYAQELLAHGFRVYAFSSDIRRINNGGAKQVARGFRFSRVVDGKTCYANAETEYFEDVKFTMPIKPSRENGSGMFVGGRNDEDVADIATAEKYASPKNWNYLTGTQDNYESPSAESLYTEITE